MSEENSEELLSPSEEKPKSSFGRLATQGAFWTLSAYGVSQILRLGSRMILTRILVKEVFGVMAIVDAYFLGVILLSDLGINASIIQNERGDERSFLDTAWTIQVIRGVLLFILFLAIAIPVSNTAFSEPEPLLRLAIPLTGLSALFAGFNSTKLAVAMRKLQMRQFVQIELAAFVVGTIVKVIWAYVDRSIWALVAGNVVTSLTLMLLSHFALKGVNNKFRWDKTAVTPIISFGIGVFFSTAFSWAVNQGSDKIIVARLTNQEFLGVYIQAIVAANLVMIGIMQLGSRVLFPSYSELVRNNPDDLYYRVRQTRIITIGLTWIGAIFFMAFGPWFITLMFGKDYSEAGWMLQIIAAGTMVSVISLTYENVIIAKGRTMLNAVLHMAHLVIMFLLMYYGNQMGGERWLVMGYALSSLIVYPVKAFAMKKLNLWQPEVDLTVIIVATSLVWLFVSFIW